MWLWATAILLCSAKPVPFVACFKSGGERGTLLSSFSVFIRWRTKHFRNNPQGKQEQKQCNFKSDDKISSVKSAFEVLLSKEFHRAGLSTDFLKESSVNNLLLCFRSELKVVVSCGSITVARLVRLMCDDGKVHWTDFCFCSYFSRAELKDLQLFLHAQRSVSLKYWS